MRRVKLLFKTLVLFVLFISCEAEVIITDDIIIDEPLLSLNQVLSSNELWYVDIHKTTGTGEVPFLQTAFTLSFRSGVLYANNNLVGIGKTGNGLGVNIGRYSTYDYILEVTHDIDGYLELDVIVIDDNEIKLYDPVGRVTYYLVGYQRSNFDYDLIFYDNIVYFLQEYEVWEKTYTSQMGAINEFDDENYLQFFEGTRNSLFRSSIDEIGTRIDNVIWDYEGIYEVFDVKNDDYVKTLTLDYDFLNDDYFELTVINDRTIELYHSNSGTIYEFSGIAPIEFLKSGAPKKRKKMELPSMNIKRQSERKNIKI